MPSGMGGGKNDNNANCESKKIVTLIGNRDSRRGQEEWGKKSGGGIE